MSLMPINDDRHDRHGRKSSRHIPSAVRQSLFRHAARNRVQLPRSQFLSHARLGFAFHSFVSNLKCSNFKSDSRVLPETRFLTHLLKHVAFPPMPRSNHPLNAILSDNINANRLFLIFFTKSENREHEDATSLPIQDDGHPNLSVILLRLLGRGSLRRGLLRGPRSAGILRGDAEFRRARLKRAAEGFEV